MKGIKEITQWLIIILLVLLLYTLFEQMAFHLKNSIPAILIILLWFLLWKVFYDPKQNKLGAFISKLSLISLFRKIRLSMAYKRFKSRTKTDNSGTIICKECGASIDPFSFGISGRCPKCGTKIL